MTLACILSLYTLLQSAAAGELPPAAAEELPIWRGFNLQERFHRDWGPQGPYREEDFQLISELGFNFVRLPMDYRFWIIDDDWERIDDSALEAIDDAIALGEQYGIHVMLNFHRAPGHTVAEPKEPVSLWEDAEAQRICAMHWKHFAERYRGIPNAQLSFNLFNEPYDVDEATYAEVVTQIVTAIREADPERLVVVDGLDWGVQPVPALQDLDVAQAGRGYMPHAVSHYNASWVAGSENWPTPRWPIPTLGGGFLYGPMQSGLRSPLEIQSDFDHNLTLTVVVGKVSTHARLALQIDGEEVESHVFTPGPGEGPWKEVQYVAEYDIYQNIYDQAITFEIPAGARTVTLENAEGDWLTLKEIRIGDGETVYDQLEIFPQWAVPNDVLTFDSETQQIITQQTQDGDWLWDNYFQHWAALREAGVGVMVGEWGAHQHTPHDVTLRWMEDCLKAYKRAGMGWTLWNFRGSFGILNSKRTDVDYEDFHGHQLDRKMLELLQRY